MTNDIWQPKIASYVDAELPEQEMRAMDAHLRGCASCAFEVLLQTRRKRETRIAGQRYSPSPAFRRRLAAEIAVQTPSRQSAPWRWTWVPALAVAAMVLIVAGVWTHRSLQDAQSRQLLAELTDLHVANLAASMPVDVVSSERHTVKPWFQGRVPFSFNLPELASSPFTLLGGRLTYLDHEPGAHLIYNIGAHHISVFIFRDQPQFSHAFSAQPSSRDILNFHLVAWSAHDLRYFVLGDASEDSIRQLSSLLEKAAP